MISAITPPVMGKITRVNNANFAEIRKSIMINTTKVMGSLKTDFKLLTTAPSTSDTSLVNLDIKSPLRWSLKKPMCNWVMLEKI